MIVALHSSLSCGWFMVLGLAFRMVMMTMTMTRTTTMTMMMLMTMMMMMTTNIMLNRLASLFRPVCLHRLPHEVQGHAGDP